MIHDYLDCISPDQFYSECHFHSLFHNCSCCLIPCCLSLNPVKWNIFLITVFYKSLPYLKCNLFNEIVFLITILVSLNIYVKPLIHTKKFHKLQTIIVVKCKQLHYGIFKKLNLYQKCTSFSDKMFQNINWVTRIISHLKILGTFFL